MTTLAAPVTFVATDGREMARRTLAKAFAQAGLDSPDIEARLLLLEAAGIDHSSLIQWPDRPLGGEAAARLEEFATRRLAHEPLTRILGHREFWGLDLTVSPGVLDPREDSETLVIAALAALKLHGPLNRPLNILDLGTGSGALLCAVLTACAQATGVGIDLSFAACKAASANLLRCNLNQRALIVQGNWADSLLGPFDLVISNPPYIETQDIAGLSPEVARHDSHLALDGGADGLKAYHALATCLPRLLVHDGIAVIEAGAGQAKAITTIFENAGFSPGPWHRDTGSHERAGVFYARKDNDPI